MNDLSFVPTLSTNDIWRDEDTSRCLTIDLDNIEKDIDKLQSDMGNIGGDYAPSNHKHSTSDVECSEADNGKFMRVVDGVAAWCDVPAAENVKF